MKRKGKWSVALFLFVIGVSSFFSSQHRLEYTTYKLDETWNLDPSLTIMLKEITVKKFMDNPMDFDRRPWYRYLLPYSPNWLITPIVRFGHFFSMPHHFDSGEIQVKGIISGDPSWREKYNIDFWIGDYQYGSTGFATEGAEGGSTFFFNIHEDKIPKEDLDFSKMIIEVNEKGNGKLKTFEYIPNNGLTEVVYDFYENRPAEYGFDPSKVATTFIFDVLKEGKKESFDKQLFPKVKEPFPWSYLPQELEKRKVALHNPFPTYEGEYKGFQEVYSVNLEYSLVDDIDIVIGKQKIYLIQDDEDSWKIIDLSPYQQVHEKVS